MTRLIKLSLATSLALSCMASADTLEEAFKASKFNGEIRGEYSDSNFLGQNGSDNIFVVGGNLGVLTGDYYGFKLGATFQTSTVLDTDDEYGVFGNSPLSNDALDVQGSVLSESYVQYTLSNTTGKFGRQYIFTPLVSTAIDGKSSQSLMKDSFEAYMITNTDIPDTTIAAGYVSKYQAKRDGDGDVGSFDKFEDGAYTAYIKNNSVEDLTLQAQYLEVDGLVESEDKTALYAQADYKIGSQTISAQYLQSQNKSQINDDGQAFGVKATGALGIWKLGYLTAYNKTSDDGNVYVGAGAGTTDTLFTAMPVDGGGLSARADTDTIVGAIVIPVATATLIAYAGESFNDKPGVGDVPAVGAVVMYPYGKNFALKANYEHVNIENTIPGVIPDENTDVARLYLSYKF
ncbi:MAG: hypothetical protein JJW00_06135 [Sulfurimonas sp.]|nr:hypothetical protein [Sulfurimonas sp.]